MLLLQHEGQVVAPRGVRDEGPVMTVAKLPDGTPLIAPFGVRPDGTAMKAARGTANMTFSNSATAAPVIVQHGLGVVPLVFLTPYATVVLSIAARSETTFQVTAFSPLGALNNTYLLGWLAIG